MHPPVGQRQRERELKRVLAVADPGCDQTRPRQRGHCLAELVVVGQDPQAHPLTGGIRVPRPAMQNTAADRLNPPVHKRGGSLD